MRCTLPKWFASWFVLLLALCAAPGPILAAPPPPEAFFAWPAMQEAVLSPDGRHLAFLAQPGDGRQALYLLELGDGKAEAHRAPAVRVLAQFKDADVRWVDWVAPDLLLFETIDLHATSAAHYREGPGLFSMQLDGRKPRELVQRRSERPVEMRAGRGQAALDFRHVRLNLPRGRGDELLIGRWDAEGLQPLWLNARTGATRDAGIERPRDARDPIRWWFDSRGEARVLLSTREGRNWLHWRGPGDAEWRRISERDALASPFDIAFVDDLGSLFVMQPRGAAGERVLTRFDFERNEPAGQALVHLPGFDLQVQPLMDEGRLIGLRLTGEREHTHWLLPAMQALQQRVDERSPGRVNRLDCRRCGAEDAVLLLESFSDRDPGQFWLLEAGGQRWRALARRLPGIDPQAMASLRHQRIVARDGLPLPLWITQPTEPAGPRPAVLLVHGGPHVRGTHWRWNAEAQFLASRGYLVIEPEFRGSTGYGARHWRAGHKQWGLAMQDDLLDALRWAQRQGLANDRACIVGGSYGGYAALMGLARQAESFRCAVAFAAVADLELMLEGGWFIQDDSTYASRRLGLPRLVGDLATERESLRERSPVHLASAIARRPLLLLHGDQDLRVPLAHAERMRAALRAVGSEPEWFVYPGEAHGLQLQAHREDHARRLEAFLARHLLTAEQAAKP
ncbi:alpha/beta hydrolase family protein [Inhella sp.]|uniref:alpha/beta hydrolase family protein n=1 Tax=Inhella sp. TaxID=1921806 RepID=UPI0035B045CE